MDPVGSTTSPNSSAANGYNYIFNYNYKGMGTTFVADIVYYQLQDSSQNHPVKQNKKRVKFTNTITKNWM